MIYCVEDDSAIRELIVYTLNAAGYTAKGFGSGQEFFECCSGETPDLVLLDLMLPAEDGISILKKLRHDERTSELPVIIASAKGTEYDKVTGLDSGADDYLVKPFGMMEMVSHIKAVMRRCGRQTAVPSNVLRTSGLVLDTSSHTVSADGRELRLTLKEYELLKCFMENLCTVMTRDKLFENVWGSDLAGETRTVDVHIGTLRMKLGGYGSLIHTVRGVGYRMESKN